MYFSSTTIAFVLSLSTFVSHVTAQDASAQKLNWSGKLSSLDAGLGGTVTVTSATKLTITDYKIDDASAPALYWWGSTTSILKDGFRISNLHITEKASTSTLEVPLDAGKTPADFMIVGLWCERFAANFGQTTLAATANDTSSSPSASSSTTAAAMSSASAAASASASSKSSGGESLKAGLKSSMVVGVAVAVAAGGMAEYFEVGHDER